MENIGFNIASEDIDDHFTEKLNDNLNKIREHLHSSYDTTPKPWSHNYNRSSDSPLTMSINGDSDDVTLKITNISTTKQDVLETLNVYFQSQKYMYDKSSLDASFKNNCLCGITITISSGICVFITFLETYQWRTIIIIVFNAIVSVLLLLSKYWKLEPSSELFYYVSRQFELISDNINNTQLTNNYAASSQQLHTKIRELEKRVIETIDIPNICIPSHIQVLCPVSSNINMFSFIKKVNTRIVFLNEELHNANLEINYISKHYNNIMGPRETNRMQYLLDKKKTDKTNLNYAENAFSYMEEILTKELNKAEYFNNKYFIKYFSEPPQFSIDHSRCNPFVDEYISFILPKKK